MRAAMGNQQAYNRYLVGGASGAEYAALKGASDVLECNKCRNGRGMANANPTGGNPSTGTGSQMLAQLARLGRLGRRGSSSEQPFMQIAAKVSKEPKGTDAAT